MFIQEKQHCPKCGKFITNPLQPHLCGFDAPVSKDTAMTLPPGFYFQKPPHQEKSGSDPSRHNP
jgi:hypothetical protein